MKTSRRKTFPYYLDKIEKLIKEKKYDEAWVIANEGIIELSKLRDESWYMMYYQMAIISSREKKWLQALEKMGFVVHYIGCLGGVTHEKFVLRLLKKFGKEDRLKDYILLAIKKNPEDFSTALKDFLVDESK